MNAESIFDNQHVKELLKTLKDNDISALKDLIDILKQVTAMEHQLNNAVNELALMRKQFDKVKAISHPALTAMDRAVINTQNFIRDFQDKLAAIKRDIVNGCKNAVSAFKEKGISALINLFKIKPTFESFRDKLNKTIDNNNKAINNIEAISNNIHEAGKHLRNVGRALLGKEASKETKPIGNVTKAFTTAYKAESTCCESIKKHVEAVIDSIAARTTGRDKAFAYRNSK